MQSCIYEKTTSVKCFPLSTIVRWRVSFNCECCLQLLCCGVTGYRDWEMNLYFNCTSPSGEACGVPFSCCKPTSVRGHFQCLISNNLKLRITLMHHIVRFQLAVLLFSLNLDANLLKKIVEFFFSTY